MPVLRKSFSQDLDAVVSSFISSTADDEDLISADLEGSLAHCNMLSAQGLISRQAADSITSGLKQFQSESDRGQFKLQEEFEDVHMNVEKQLQSLIGEDALRLHTARSRNDQVATDLRLYVRAQIQSVSQLIGKLEETLLACARQNSDCVMPGYTHLQRAQPIYFAHAILAFYQMFARDLGRFKQVADSAMVSPLGACAQAGTSLSINPQLTAEQLGFKNIFANSIDAVSDRDFALEFLLSAAVTATHLSQLAETLIIWNSSEFDFLEFADSVTTTSSLMPQKKNPDPLEIIRARSGLATGELVNLLVVLKGLPLGYNRDLQESKTPVIRVSRSLASCLEVMTIVISNLKVKPVPMLKAASDPDLMATDLVEYLVLKNVPFRKAHEAVASLVQVARLQSCPLSHLSLETFKQFCPDFEDDIRTLFNPVRSAASRLSPGGTGQLPSVLELLANKSPDP